MNNNQNINKEMSRSFAKFGLIVLLLTGVFFAGKSFLGYTKVRMYDTYNCCTVSTSTRTVRTSKGGSKTEYHVKVVCKDPEMLDKKKAAAQENKDSAKKDSRMKVKIKYDNNNNASDYDEKDLEEEVLFSAYVPREYYKHFRDYKDTKVTIFTTDWGRRFPVWKPGCNEVEAEREYRKLDPPVLWEILYAIGIGVGVLSLIMGLRTKRTADNYSDDRVYEPDFRFSSTEDALAGMAHARIQREKEEARQRKRYGHRLYNSENRSSLDIFFNNDD